MLAEKQAEALEREKPKTAADFKAEREEQERNAHTRKLICWFYGVQLLAMGLQIAGIFTQGWFTSTVEAETIRQRVGGSQDSQSSPVTQEWAMGFTFVTVVVEFCVHGEACTTTRDQNMYYDNTLNSLSSKWPDTYKTSLESVLGGQAGATGCWTLWGLGVTACGYMFMASLAWKATRHKIVMIGNMIVLIAAGGLGFLGVILFSISTEDLREQLTTDDVFAEPLMNTNRPSMSVGYSPFLCFCAVGISLSGIIPILKANSMFRAADAASMKIVTVRDKRIKQYFADVANTTYQKEKHPLDTLHNSSQTRKPGWTTEVMSQPVNQMVVYDLDTEERLGTAIPLSYDPFVDETQPNALNSPAAEYERNPEVDVQLQRQFGKTCAFKLDQDKLDEGLQHKQKQVQSQRQLPRKKKIERQELLPGMVQDINYTERDRKVTRAPQLPKQQNVNGMAVEISQNVAPT